jgi:hypothetical protein
VLNSVADRRRKLHKRSLVGGRIVAPRASKRCCDEPQVTSAIFGRAICVAHTLGSNAQRLGGIDEHERSGTKPQLLNFVRKISEQTLAHLQRVRALSSLDRQPTGEPEQLTIARLLRE